MGGGEAASLVVDGISMGCASVWTALAVAICLQLWYALHAESGWADVNIIVPFTQQQYCH